MDATAGQAAGFRALAGSAADAQAGSEDTAPGLMLAAPGR